MRNYALATFNMDAWKEGFIVPECWAFFGIGTQEETADLGRLLDLQPRPWLKAREWVVAFDIVALTAFDFISEVNAKRWELKQFGVSWQWSTDLIPEAPAESMQGALMNTYISEEEFDRTLISPLDVNKDPELLALHVPQVDVPRESRPVDLPDAIRVGRFVSDTHL